MDESPIMRRETGVGCSLADLADGPGPVPAHDSGQNAAIMDRLGLKGTCAETLTQLARLVRRNEKQFPVVERFSLAPTMKVNSQPCGSVPGAFAPVVG